MSSGSKSNRRTPLRLLKCRRDDLRPTHQGPVHHQCADRVLTCLATDREKTRVCLCVCVSINLCVSVSVSVSGHVHMYMYMYL